MQDTGKSSAEIWWEPQSCYTAVSRKDREKLCNPTGLPLHVSCWLMNALASLTVPSVVNWKSIKPSSQ